MVRATETYEGYSGRHEMKQEVSELCSCHASCKIVVMPFIMTTYIVKISMAVNTITVLYTD